MRKTGKRTTDYADDTDMKTREIKSIVLPLDGQAGGAFED
jgi:hypothetical protein